MDYVITKEDIALMKGDELITYLYQVEVDIHSIEFSLTHDGISEYSAVYQDMVLDLKELRDLHEDLMDEVVIRKDNGE